MKLIIVESPTKVSSIYDILHSLDLKGFFVIGTAGHIQNLPEHKLSVEFIKGNYIAHDEVMSKKKEIVAKIKKAAKTADDIYICTDDDREGEKIAEDIVILCGIKKYKRVTFREISKSALKDAFLLNKNVKFIDKKIVLAQRTRRIIDRVIGYRLSDPIKHYFKTQNINMEPRSTGRIEALSLDIVIEREIAIEDFKQNDEGKSKVIIATYIHNHVPFQCKGRGLVFSEDNINEFEATKNKIKQYDHIVSDVDNKIRKVAPPKRLISIDIYTRGSYIIKTSPSDIAKRLQLLFELSLITYHRTDSHNISDEAVEDIMIYLEGYLKPEHQEHILRAKRKIRKTNPLAQEAHECIRPLHINNRFSPQNIRNEIKENQNKYKKLQEEDIELYRYIWNVTIASQLKDSIYDATKITIIAGEFIFEQTAHHREYLGWECLELESLKDKDSEAELYNKREVIIPESIFIDEKLPCTIESYMKIPHAPKTISEQTLIKKLDSQNVARPSTLPSFSKKLIEKGYLRSIKNILYSTDLGKEISKLTKKHLDWLTSFERNKELEEAIVLIEEGEVTDTNYIIDEYWRFIEDFKKEINYVGDEYIQKAKCPNCSNFEIKERTNDFKCDSCSFISFKKKNFAYLSKVSSKITREEHSNEITINILINGQSKLENGKCLIFDYNSSFKNYNFKIVKCFGKTKSKLQETSSSEDSQKEIFISEMKNIFKNRNHHKIANKIATLTIQTKKGTSNKILFNQIEEFAKNFKNKKCFLIDDKTIIIAFYGENILYARDIMTWLKKENDLQYKALKAGEYETADEFVQKGLKV